MTDHSAATVAGAARTVRDDCNMTSVATEVELTFTEPGPQLTLVTVEHRGWNS